MKLPADLVVKRLHDRGAVLRVDWRFKDGTTKPKFLIVVGADTTVDPVILVMATSKVSWYSQHGDAAHVSISAGEMDSFCKDTVVDCRRLHALTRVEIRSAYDEGRLTFQGIAPDTVMARITKAILSSKTLKVSEKRMVVPNDDD